MTRCSKHQIIDGVQDTAQLVNPKGYFLKYNFLWSTAECYMFLVLHFQGLEPEQKSLPYKKGKMPLLLYEVKQKTGLTSI